VTEEVEVDPETLAAIDRALEDLKAGRTISPDEVRERVRQWTSNSHLLNRLWST
jgi:predicted transcriptional regulator